MRSLASVVAATLVAGHCVVPMAMAEADRSFEGRWTAENHSLTLDVSRCGDGWCGVEVTAAGSCGRTVLRPLATEELGSIRDRHSRTVMGRLELAAQAQPYAVELLDWSTPGVTDRLMIHGDSSDKFFSVHRRSYPYEVAFTRTGGSACRPDPKVS